MSIFPTSILLATDGSKDSELAATTAVGLSKVTGSELCVLHVRPVVPEHFEPKEIEPARMEQESERILKEQVKKIEYLGATVAQSHLRRGKAAEEVVDLAEELRAGLIAIGSRGRGRIKRLLMGSISNSVLRQAHCPVLVVRWKPVAFPAKILFATDSSEEATLAAKTAAELTKRTGSELHLVTVAPEYPYVYVAYHDIHHMEVFERSRQEAREGRPVEDLLELSEEIGADVIVMDSREWGQKTLDEQAWKVDEAGGTVAKNHLRVGAANEEIVVLAEDLKADLIVLGSRGLGGMRRALMGSVSDSVVRNAHCPVMVVRPEKQAVT